MSRLLSNILTVTAPLTSSHSGTTATILGAPSLPLNIRVSRSKSLLLFVCSCLALFRRSIFDMTCWWWFLRATAPGSSTFPRAGVNKARISTMTRGVYTLVLRLQGRLGRVSRLKRLVRSLRGGPVVMDGSGDHLRGVRSQRIDLLLRIRGETCSQLSQCFGRKSTSKRSIGPAGMRKQPRFVKCVESFRTAVRSTLVTPWHRLPNFSVVGSFV
jgi:hypothetical protein